MKIDIENLHGNFKKISIEVPAEVVTKHFDGHFKDIQKNAELKGFRKGKAPTDLIRKMYGDSAASYVTRSIVEHTLFQSLKEKSMEPVGTPKVEAGMAIDMVPFKYSATFELMPTVELKEYTGLKLKKENSKASETEIEMTLKQISERQASFEILSDDHKAEPGLLAVMNYKATEAGKDVPEASEENGEVELGAGLLFEGFEKEVMGMKSGDKKSFTVKFPEAKTDQEKTPVSGRTIDFDVEMKNLKKKILPVINDEFAKKVGPFQSLQELKDRVAKDIEDQKVQQNRRQNQEAFIKWLIEKNPVEVPETMLNAQMEQLAVDAGAQLSRMGLKEDAIETRLKEWAPEMQERAGGQVKASLLLGAIADKEQIQVNDDDLRRELIQMAVASGGRQKPTEIWEDLQKRGLAGGLLRQVQELKALDWALAKAEEG